MANGEALSRLRGIRLNDLTTEQLNSVLGTTTLTPATADALIQGSMASEAVRAQRTYAWGLPIPDAGVVVSFFTGPGGTVTLQPTGSEVWDIKAIKGNGEGGAATTTMSYTDGSVSLPFRVGDTIAEAGTNYDLNEKISAPIVLTNSMYITVEETGTTNGLTILVAYQVVSL